MIQGYTPEFCAHSWEVSRLHQVETYQKFARGEDSQISADLALMASTSLSDWLELVRRQEKASPDKVITGRHQPWHIMSLLGAPNDVLVQLALLSDAFPSSQVWMDCSFLYDDDDDPRTPHQIAEEGAAEFADFPEGKIIVLTEGKSDTRIITAALKAFYPEYADAYQFIDFEEFRIEGGASVLARMVKILSGARIQNRLLALFDNDAAGAEAIQSLSRIRFPRNVRLMMLPNTKLARSYPTLGPSGRLRMDVNGSAAPIELFLGRSSLITPEGTLRPIRWSQWKDNVERYQGVVDDKDAICSAFLASLEAGSSPSTLRRSFPEMNLLLQSIFRAFEDNTPPLI
ncbi:hypothetical protein [Allosphingosinicella flava]